MLICVLGNVGSGKTLLLTILGSISKFEIVSNYHLEYNFIEFNIQDFLKAKYDNCNVFLDEAYAYLESRISGSELNRLMSYILFQSRKKSINIYLTAQLFSSLDKRFRMLSDIIILCKNDDKNNCYRYKLINKQLNKTIDKVITYKMALSYYNLYDTNEIIQPLNSENFYLKNIAGKDKMKQIEESANLIIENNPNIKITKGIVSLECIAHDIPSFLEEPIYTYIKQLRRKENEK